MEKVRVYWNLHKHKWSVQNCKTGLVTDHKQHITLQDAKFVVRKGGQERVRKEGKKNVHAFAVGYISEFSVPTSERLKLEFGDWDRVKYNPYTDDYFMHQGIGHDTWNEIPRDFVGNIHMESLHHENGVAPRVYI
jgi:hypothetical protein|tara:strand:+ start:1226 stop:1630 length:405 start_codon:yes stop_codon:yes gene_type:complete